MVYSFKDLFKTNPELTGESDVASDFIRETAVTNYNRLSSIMLILFLLSIPLMYIDYRHSISGDWAKTPGYYMLFWTHVAMFAMGLGGQIASRLLNPKKYDRKLTAYQSFNIFVTIFILLWCSATSVIDQFIHTNITVYMLGILCVASFLYLHIGTSLFLYMTTLTAFLIGLGLVQKNQDILIGHFINATAATTLAWFFSRVFYHAYTKDFTNARTIGVQKRELMRTNQQLNNAYEEVHQAYNKLSQKDNEMSEDLKIAREIQEKLLKPKEPSFKGLDVHVEYLPKIAIGGDVFDIYETGAGQFRVFLGDSMGHGFQAALTALLIRSEYERIKNKKLPPDKVIQDLRDEFFAKYDHVTEFFTCIVIDLDFKKNKLRYASASQPIQYLIQDGKLHLLEPTGMFASILSPKPYKSKELAFKKGDALLLFTDGLFDELNEEKKSIGEKKLEEFLTNYYNIRKNPPIRDTIGYVLTEISYHLYGNDQNDDITVIGIERK